VLVHWFKTAPVAVIIVDCWSQNQAPLWSYLASEKRKQERRVELKVYFDQAGLEAAAPRFTVHYSRRCETPAIKGSRNIDEVIGGDEVMIKVVFHCSQM